MGFGLVRSRASLTQDEPIEMRQLRYGYFPRVFRWHGHSYRVHAVERCWIGTSTWSGDGHLCFSVRCAEGKFELYQDLVANTWHLRRAKWNPRNVRQPQRGTV
jgi:hypothetical protein